MEFDPKLESENTEKEKQGKRIEGICERVNEVMYYGNYTRYGNKKIQIQKEFKVSRSLCDGKQARLE